MLVIAALPVILFTQVVLASPSYRELRDLADVLAAEERFNGDLNHLIEGKRDAANRDNMIQECEQMPLELGLVIDSSASIRTGDFVKGQAFLSDFLAQYDIGPGPKQVRVTGVTFGRGVYMEDSFGLDSYHNTEEVTNHVAHMPHRYGDYTDTGKALEIMRTQLMVNTRKGVPKIVFVITDGNSQLWRFTREQAYLLKDTNVTTFVIGVGHNIKEEELVNIAGGDASKVIRANSYSDLDDDLKTYLKNQACEWVPIPTTTPMPTTTTVPAAEACSTEYPTDINFIFSPATLGLDATGWVTQFISRTIEDEQFKEGFRYGVVTGDCPDDEGFNLNRYSNYTAVREHLLRYDRNSLPALVRKTAADKFTVTSGARDNAAKAAVIFLGEGKMGPSALNDAVEELTKKGVQVYVSLTSPKVSRPSLPGVTFLDSPKTSQQAAELVSHICHLQKNEDSTDEGSDDDDC